MAKKVNVEVPEDHTLYYRYDHKKGFAFHNNTPPSLEDGWVSAPENIKPEPEATYECTSLAAFQELLRTERAASQIMLEELHRMRNAVADADSKVRHITRERDKLSVELTNLKNELGRS